MSVLVDVKQVAKNYQSNKGNSDQALHPISFQLQAGQVLGLLGHNGAGKSTLINALLGSHFYSGKVSVCGLDPIDDHSQMMEHLAYISDVNVLPEWMSVKQLINYTSGVHPSFSREQAIQALAKTDIKLNSQIKQLSKGMKVQLHLAIVIATDTKVLILDEPTLGLDLLYRDTFYQELQQWFKRSDRALIITSHEVTEIEHLLTDVLILKQGKAIFQDSMSAISEQYFTLQAPKHLRSDVEKLSPLSINEQGEQLHCLFKQEQKQPAESLGSIHPASLTSLFIALQKENR